MSSHREAPAISKDPVADNTDTYAFVSPDDPGTVTIISNYLPLEAPFGGPNFFEFGDDVLYEIHIDNDADGRPDITYQFEFTTQVANPDTFLYNTGPITAIDSPNWNRRQFYSVTRVDRRRERVLATGLACPPCNIGPSSTPNYAALASQAVHGIPGGHTVFAGQRLEGFYVDLGAIFDLGDLRPLQNLHLASMVPPAAGVNATNDFGVHAIALKIPISQLTKDGSTPTNPMSQKAVIGVWAAARRRRAVVREPGFAFEAGPWVQVSRLGNPLFNEVIVPMGDKDRWNALPASEDKQFLKYVQHPELAGLLPVLYPGVFPNLAGSRLKAARADLVAILLTGLPAGIVPGFQNFTGSTLADQLRLNVAIPPTPSAKVNALGLVAGDVAGFPNGRRVFDDVVTIELRAIAGLTYPLVNPSYTPDAGGQRDHRRADGRQHQLPVAVPVSRDTGERLRDEAAGGMRGVTAMTAATNGHLHEHPAEDLGSQHAASASVALDIGEGRGALVIYPSERYRGTEIEISRVDGDGRRVHTGVHERSTRAGSKLTAIFGSLETGDYVVWADETTARTTIRVADGAVTELFLI